MATAIKIQTQFLDTQVTVIGAKFSPNIRGLLGATNYGAAFIMPDFLAGTPQFITCRLLEFQNGL